MRLNQEKETNICGETYYNVPKICAFMGGLVHPETIKAKIRSGKLKAIKLKRELWAKPSWIIDYMKSLENTEKKAKKNKN